MRFIKYLLNGIINCIDAFAGKSNNGVSIQQALFGLLFLAMSIAIFFVFLIFFDKTFGTKIYINVVLSVLSTMVIIALIFVIFIVVEKIFL